MKALKVESSDNKRRLVPKQLGAELKLLPLDGAALEGVTASRAAGTSCSFPFKRAHLNGSLCDSPQF